MTPADAESKAALFTKPRTRAARVHRRPPQWRWFAPGRIEILGKHTGYAGGHSLLAAVPRGIAVVARARTDGIVRLHDVRDGQRIEVDPRVRRRPAIAGSAVTSTWSRGGCS